MSYTPNVTPSPTTTKGDLIVRGTSVDVRLGVGSDGQSVKSDANSTNGLAWFTSGMGNFSYVSGRYYGSTNSLALTSASNTLGVMYATPVYIWKRQAFTAIGINATVAVASNIRMGIYADSGGVPGSRIIDCGVAALSLGVTGQYDVAISQTLDIGNYWLVVLGDTAGNTLSAISTNSLQFLGTNGGAGTAPRIQKTQAYGALPTPFGSATYSEGNSSMNIQLKV